MNDCININDTYKLLNENTTFLVDTTKDDPTTQNKFKIKPLGILVQDTYNNPFFPIQPMPQLDTSKFDLPFVFKRYRDIYLKATTLFLPWHFVVEFIDNKYYVFNTRPIDTKFPMTTYDARNIDQSHWDDNTKKYMLENVFNIEDAIHVAILGDTNTDVYTKKTYEVIGRHCINPIVRMFRMPGSLFQRILPINIGDRFNLTYIEKFIRN